MASIPMAGMPDAKFFTPPGRRREKGKYLPKGQAMFFVGIDELVEGFEILAKNTAAPMRKAALMEIGLFGEAEVKIRTPVEYGVLRASIGHYDPSQIKASAVGPTDAREAEASAVFEVGPSSVEWGTNLHYAPWIEDGFTMRTRRAVWFDDVQGFRMVDPFSYRGAHMFAAAMPVIENALPTIVGFWIEEAAKASGMDPS